MKNIPKTDHQRQILKPQTIPSNSSSKESITAADIIGALKNPPRLKISYPIDEEAVWCSLLTLFTITPVAIGINAAPKNKRLQSRGIMYIKLFINPIGIAKSAAKLPNPATSLIAVKTFFPLYPP